MRLFLHSNPAMGSDESRDGLSRLATWVVCLVIMILGPRLRADEVTAASPGSTAPVRFAFSSNMFVDVNENDARASVKAFALTMAKERNIPIDSSIILLNGTEAIRKALKGAQVDAVTLTTLDYWQVSRDVTPGPIILGFKDGKSTEEYILLVNNDSAITQLSQLRGKNVMFFRNPRACLAPAWVETLLLEKGLGRSSKFWRHISQETKLTKTILPLFFHQVDACIVTRAGFSLMTELNPQVGKQLRILAVSQPMVPAIFFFRNDYDSPFRDQLLKQAVHFYSTVAGEQVLTLFQSDNLSECPLSDLASAFELLDRHKRLCDEQEAAERKETRTP